jgi:hypothetical protein
MPPVSGPDSFNYGAGMARLITAANFIHFNMPHGTYYLDPQLTVEEAWDVAAYLISLPRPHKQRPDRDRTFSRGRSTPPTVRMLTASVRNSICTAPSYLFAKRSRVSRQKGDCSAIGSVSPSKADIKPCERDVCLANSRLEGNRQDRMPRRSDQNQRCGLSICAY